MITHIPAKRIDSMGVYPYSDSLMDSLKRTDKQGNVYYMGYRYQDNLMVPRSLVGRFDYDGRVRNPMTGGPLPVNMDYRDHDQKECTEKAIQLLKEGVNFIFKAPTGWGKSYAGARLIQALGQKTLVIVPKTDLIKGWRKNFFEVLGWDRDRVGHVQADHIDWQGKDVVIATVQTVVKFEKLGIDFYNYFGFVLWDEGHRMAAETFSLSCRLFPALLRVAFTATPKRGDGRIPLVEAHIGPVLVKGKNIPMIPKVLVVHTGWKVPAYTAEGRKLIVNPSRLSSVIQAMGLSNSRNAYIINFAMSVYRNGRTNVIMAEHIDNQLKPIYKLLLDAGVNPVDIGWYIGGKKDIELEQAAHKKIVLTTFKMCAEGTDYPHWDCLTMCNPKATAEQMVGRVLRKKEGKLQPVILELVDNHPVLQGFAKSRLKEYYALKADIVQMN